VGLLKSPDAPYVSPAHGFPLPPLAGVGQPRWTQRGSATSATFFEETFAGLTIEQASEVLGIS